MSPEAPDDAADAPQNGGAETDALSNASGSKSSSTHTRTIAREELDHSLVRRFRLVATNGPEAGTVFESTGARTVIGTHKTADFVLADPTVSRFHCEIEVVEGRALLRDLDSRNGTFIDGVEVFSAVIGSNATLEIGDTKLQFALRADHVEVQLSAQERFGFLSGCSKPMRAVFLQLKKGAQSDVAILLHGEAGTGKDLAAASVHFESARREGPFVAVDCGAGPDAVLERFLFGERPRPGEDPSDRAGAIEQAAHGTLYLDEVADLSLNLQGKLLRALEKGVIQHPGETHEIPIDVRIIASTRHNLRIDVNAKRFRSAFYMYLAVLEVSLPPLRERVEDLPILVPQLLETIGATDHPAAASLRSVETVERLSRHSWPGNLRELRVYLERCVALEQVAPLGPVRHTAQDELPPIDTTIPLRVGRDEWVRFFERKYLSQILEENALNVSASARAAGLDRVHFYRLLARAGLK